MWEKSQNRPQQSSVVTKSVMDKEFDGQAWSTSHGNEFQDLIAKARESRKVKEAAKKEPPDDERAAQSPDVQVRVPAAPTARRDETKAYPPNGPVATETTRAHPPRKAQD